MQTDWASEHSGALREYLAKGMSFAEIAQAINAKFKTAYSRNAAIGRAKRMGLTGPARSQDLPKHWPSPPKDPQPQLRKPRQHRAPESMRPMPIFEPTKAVNLRCVEIHPRQQGEAITFCGRPRRQGSSYCILHFHLTRGPGTASERAAGAVLLRLVEAAEPRTAHDADGRHEAAAVSRSHRAFT